MKPVTLYRVDPSKNMFHFYRLNIQARPVREPVFTLRMRRNRALQSDSDYPLPDRRWAQLAFHKLRATKERRGYVKKP